MSATVLTSKLTSSVGFYDFSHEFVSWYQCWTDSRLLGFYGIKISFHQHTLVGAEQ